jgi:hypothetical protein
MKRLPCLTFTAIALLVGAQLAVAAPPTIGILLHGRGLSAETELSIRDAINGKGLKVIDRKNLRAAMSFAPKGAKGWDKASLTALKDASGASYLLFVKAKRQRGRVAIMISLFHNSSVESKVISARKSNVNNAVQKAIAEMLGAKPGSTSAKGTLQRGPTQVGGPYSYRIQMGLGGLMTMPYRGFFAAADFFVTGGMRRGLQGGLQSTMFIDGGVFQHWLLAGYGGDGRKGTAVFFGVGLAGNHGLNITNSARIVILATLGKTRPNKLVFTLGFSVYHNFSMSDGYMLVTLGASYGN